VAELVIKGGTLLDAAGERAGDVAIDGGRIVAVGHDLRADQELDAGGCVVTPGLVDLFADLGQPGHEEADCVETATRAAALGGYTAVVASPVTDPVADCASVIREIQMLADGALCDVAVSGAITVGCAGSQLAPLGEMAALGVRLFTDGHRGVQDDGLMRRALEYAGGLGVTLAQHCENESLSDGGHMHEGVRSSILGVPGIPAEAEELMVMRDVTLSRMTGASVHLRRLSTAGSLGILRAAKAAGLRVTADVAAHHLTLTDDAVAGYDPVFKVNPPLRTRDDVAAVISAVNDGVIDAIVSDHSPHEPHLKELPFDQAPAGGIGLETTLSVALTDAGLSLPVALAALSWRPAALAGLGDTHGTSIEPGQPANIAVFDPTATWQVAGANSASRSRNTPFEGRTLKGRVRHTIVHGEAVVTDGEAQR
jgi:dihydroorotase